MTDDRIVLPLNRTRESAALLCEALWCRVLADHHRLCLIPLLDRRDAMLADTYVGKVSPDCEIGGVKCAACTGCLHDCHRHSRRAA